MLRALVGRDDADFHDGQFEAIEALVDGRRRALVVQRTGWGKSAVYFVATLLLRRRGAGPTVLVSPLLALMRDQIAAARAPGCGRSRSTPRTRTSGAMCSPSSTATRSTCCWCLPSGSTTRRSATSSCRSWCRGSDCSSSTRRTASATGATTSAPTTDGCATSSRACPPAFRCSRRPRPPTAASCRMSPSSSMPAARRGADAAAPEVLVDPRAARAHLAAARRAATARRAEPARVAHQPPRRPARLGHHLHAHGRGGERHGAAAARPRLRGARVHRADRSRRARGVRGAPEGQPGQGARGDQRAGHGIRQARPRLRRASRRALVAGVVLPAGRSRGARHRVGRRAAAPRRRGPRHLALLRHGVDARPRTRGARALGARRGGRPAVDAGARGDGRHPSHSAGAAAEGARCRRCGRPRAAAGGSRPATRGPTTRSATPHRRRAHRRAAAHDRVRRDVGACRMEFLQRSLDDDTAAPCGRCDNCAGAWFPTAIAAETRRMPHPPPSTASACRSNRGGSGRPAPTGSACRCKGRISADEQSEEGRALARLTDLGWGGTLRELFAAGAADAPVPPNVLAACVRVLAEWGWESARSPSSRCRRDRSRSWSTRWRAASPRSADCRSSAPSSSSTAARRASRAATARSGSPGSGGGSGRRSRRPRRSGAARGRPRRQRWTLDGRRAGAAPRRARPACSRSPWRCAADAAAQAPGGDFGRGRRTMR